MLRQVVLSNVKVFNLQVMLGEQVQQHLEVSVAKATVAQSQSSELMVVLKLI